MKNYNCGRDQGQNQNNERAGHCSFGDSSMEIEGSETEQNQENLNEKGKRKNMKEIKDTKKAVDTTRREARREEAEDSSQDSSQDSFQNSDSEGRSFSFMNMVGNLAQILSDHNLTEVEYEEKGRRIYLAKQERGAGGSGLEERGGISKEEWPCPSEDRSLKQNSSAEKNASAFKDESAEKKEGSKEEKPDYKNHPGTIKSPMVGVVYVAPEPGAEPFIRVGDLVHPGQTLLIVEAMKVLNPIKATKAGRVVDILIHDRKPVEYDEPLVVIEE